MFASQLQLDRACEKAGQERLGPSPTAYFNGKKAQAWLLTMCIDSGTWEKKSAMRQSS